MVDAVEERKIQAALGSAALVAENVVSTSIPGILAKPTIDILLAVRDSSDERAYVPALESPVARNGHYALAANGAAGGSKFRIPCV